MITVGYKRKQYESSADLANEKTIIEVACTAWQCTAFKIPISYKLDFALSRNGRVQAFAEIKRRSHDRFKYPTAFISYRKVLCAQAFQCPCFLIVGWDDQVGYTRLDNGFSHISIGGRLDRKDAADLEPVAHFNVGEFKKIA